MKDLILKIENACFEECSKSTEILDRKFLLELNYGDSILFNNTLMGLFGDINHGWINKKNPNILITEYLFANGINIQIRINNSLSSGDVKLWHIMNLK